MDPFHYFEECIEKLMHGTELPDPSPLQPCSQRKGTSLLRGRGKGMLPQVFLLGHLRMADWDYLSLRIWHSQEMHSKAGPWQEPLLCLTCQLAFAKHLPSPSLGLRDLCSYCPAISHWQLYLPHPLGTWLLKLCLLVQNLFFQTPYFL